MGLNDIMGNVYEFTADGQRDYTEGHEVDPIGPDPETIGSAMIRGGDAGNPGMNYSTEIAYQARPAWRNSWRIDRVDGFWIGFRLLLEEGGSTAVEANRGLGEMKRALSQWK